MQNSFGTENEQKRESWISKQLSFIFPGNSILDAGAGDQHHKKNCKHLVYTSQDFSKYDGSGNNQGLQTGTYEYGKLDIISDIISIPREDESFDSILCSEVLEHVPYPDKAIKEFARLLKPKGKLLLTAPFCSLTHFAPYHYSTGFSIYWYEAILGEYGFDIVTSEAYGNYFEYLAQELHRLPYVAANYSKINPTTEEQSYFENVINILSNYSRKSINSWQLLNFGFLIEAEKRG